MTTRILRFCSCGFMLVVVIGIERFKNKKEH